MDSTLLTENAEKKEDKQTLWPDYFFMQFKKKNL